MNNLYLILSHLKPLSFLFFFFYPLFQSHFYRVIIFKSFSVVGVHFGRILYFLFDCGQLRKDHSAGNNSLF